MVDIALKQHPSTIYKCLGGAYYQDRRNDAIRPWASVCQVPGPEGYEMWQGYRPSVVMTGKGAMMQVRRPHLPPPSLPPRRIRA